VVVVAIEPSDGEMEFNPPASHIIHSGDTLVVIGKVSELKDLEKDCLSR
jgi:K+/H+ antiporter YhaU regulatory subunit KhtT